MNYDLMGTRYIGEPCLTCGLTNCPGAPRFKGICKLRSSGSIRFPDYQQKLVELRKLAEVKGAPGSMERFLAPVYEPKETNMKYIVWTPQSDLPPTIIHPDRQTAIKVAGRMAHENPGKTFYVCKLTNSAVKPIPVDVKYEDLDR